MIYIAAGIWLSLLLDAYFFKQVMRRVPLEIDLTPHVGHLVHIPWSGFLLYFKWRKKFAPHRSKGHSL